MDSFTSKIGQILAADTYLESLDADESPNFANRDCD